MSSPFEPRRRSHNLQIAEVVNALADSDPDLFDNESAALMPVKVSARLDRMDTDNPAYALLRDAIAPVICDKHLDKTIKTHELTTLRRTLMSWAHLHADEQARYWRELLSI